MLSLKILPGDLGYPGMGFWDGRKADWSDTFPSHCFTGAFLLGRATSLEGVGDRPEAHLVPRLPGTHRYISGLRADRAVGLVLKRS